MRPTRSEKHKTKGKLDKYRVNETAIRKSMRPSAVEKDFWTCWVLMN